MPSFDDQPLFQWVLLPLLIFLARTLDMSLSTLRFVFISQGRQFLAPLVGFFESLLWLLVIGQALQHLSNPLCVLAYAGGFAFGNLMGLKIEQKLALGFRILRIILHQDADHLVAALRAQNLRVTEVDGEGARGPVKILFTLLPRRNLDSVLAVVREHNPRAFFSVEDVRQAADGILPRSTTASLPVRPDLEPIVTSETTHHATTHRDDHSQKRGITPSPRDEPCCEPC